MKTYYFGNFWNAWLSPSKYLSTNSIVPICSKRSCLSTCKKWTSSLTSFLKYWKEIANLLIWVFCICLFTHTQNDSNSLEKTLYFICRPKNHLHPSSSKTVQMMACQFTHIQKDTIIFCFYNIYIFCRLLYLSASKKTQLNPP